MFSFNNNSDYEENKSGTKHPFVPSSRCPSRAFYMRASFSVIASMFKVEPTIEWLPRLSPQLVGSAFSDHYLGGWVARPLNSLPHYPFPDRHRTIRGSQADQPPNIWHHLGANANFEDGRFWTSDVPSWRFTTVCPYLHSASASMYISTYDQSRDYLWPPLLRHPVTWRGNPWQKHLGGYIGYNRLQNTLLPQMKWAYTEHNCA